MNKSKDFTGDPYFYVREDLEHRLSVTRELYEKWSTIVAKGAIAYTSQFRIDTKKLLQNLQELEELVAELQKCISDVESHHISKDAAQYIDTDEIIRRKSYLNDVRDLVKSIRDNMDATKSALEKSQKEAKKDLKKKLKEAKDADEEETAGLIRGVKAKQEEIVKAQDEVLVEMGDQLTRLNNIATDINGEVHEQTLMVHDLDNHFETAQVHLDVARGKVQRLLKTNNCWEIKVILYLIITIIILLLILRFM
ncbi:hypothetical protein WA158_000532 [Blastocystis sp. Blastoise]